MAKKTKKKVATRKRVKRVGTAGAATTPVDEAVVATDSEVISEPVAAPESTEKPSRPTRRRPRAKAKAAPDAIVEAPARSAGAAAGSVTKSAASASSFVPDAPPAGRPPRSEAKAAAPASPATSDIRPHSPNATVESAGNAVVIRFPPAGRPPSFGDPIVKPAAAAAPATKPASPPEPAPQADDDEDLDAGEGAEPVDRWQEIAEAIVDFEDAEDAAAVELLPASEEAYDDESDESDEPAAADASDREEGTPGQDRRSGRGRDRDRDGGRDRELTPEEFKRLSPSQKRRLRRRRRAQQRSEGAPADVGEQKSEPSDRVAPAQDDEGVDELREPPEREELADSRPESEAEAPATDEQDRDRGEGRDRRGRRRRRPRRHGGRPDHTGEPIEIDGEARVEGPATVADMELEPLNVEDETPSTAPVGRKEMIINVVPREECRIAILKEGKLEEIYIERASSENHVGNIYKGVVTNVEPSIQAAFIDFGLGKNGFLHISDLHPQYFPNGDGQTENVGRKLPRRHRPPIQRCLRRGQEVIVQITKEGIGTKGPTLTTYISIPGRFLVMMPGMRQLGVSRKIEDDDTRSKLRAQMDELELPDDIGFIARTAAQERTKRELQSDLNYLTRLWRAVEKRLKQDRAPAELYRESDLVIRTIRDVFTADIARIIVDDLEVCERAREFLSVFSPRSRDMVIHYQEPTPVFHRYGIEAELERLHSRHVLLRSGGSLVIDQTEALVAIDVNSGRFRTEDDAETTAFKINMEAADEIPRQLRLRDLGGVIVCDFIDMRLESHRREVERRLIKNLKEHKERAKVLRMSAFGIIEMTRQRQRASLTRSVYQDCRHCRGTGLVKTPESVVLDVMRLIQLAVTREDVRSIEVTTCPEVAYLLQNRKRSLLHNLETLNQRSILIRPDPNSGQDQVQIQCVDVRGRIVQH